MLLYPDLPEEIFLAVVGVCCGEPLVPSEAILNRQPDQTKGFLSQWWCSNRGKYGVVGWSTNTKTFIFVPRDENSFPTQYLPFLQTPVSSPRLRRRIPAPLFLIRRQRFQIQMMMKIRICTRLSHTSTIHTTCIVRTRVGHTPYWCTDTVQVPVLVLVYALYVQYSVGYAY